MDAPPPPPPRDAPPPPPPRGAPPLLSRRGEPIKMMPGWSAEQSKVYQDLNDRMPGVAKAFGANVDVMRATEQQRAEGNRFVQGSPAMLNMPDDLTKIQESNADPTTTQRLAQEAFGRVEALDTFVTGVQQRDGITDAGVRKLPLLSEEQSKTYAAQMERVTSIAAGYNEALKATPNDPKLQKSIMSFQRSNAFMAGMPEVLKNLEERNAEPSQRDEQVSNLLKTADGIDRQFGAWQLDVAGYAAQRQYGAQSQTPSKPGFFRRAFNAVKAFGNRVLDAISPNRNAASGAPGITIGAPQASAQNGKPVAPSQSQANVPSPALAPRPSNRLGVEAGNAASVANVGNGFVAAGTVKGVGEIDGKTQLDYEFRGHDQVVKVNSVGRDGKANPLSEAIRDLKPADEFKLAISQDSSGIQMAQLDNRTSGKSVDVRETGIEPHAAKAKDTRSMGLGSN
jgi:hypothetical protein